MRNIEIALDLEKRAGTKEEIQEMISFFEAAVHEENDNLLALWKQGQYYLLLGAAHSFTKKEKRENYKKSIAYCERAMFKSIEFRDLVKENGKIWEHVHVLGKEYVDAMGFWYTARCYYFKECLSVVGRILNVSMMINNEPIIARIDELNPAWEGGGNNLSRAIYLIALPKKFGGSKIKAKEEFSKAIEMGPNYLMHRWGRAKYLSSLTGDKEKYIEDLHWVLNQDPRKCGNPYPWNIYFQNEAQKMLAQVNNVF